MSFYLPKADILVVDDTTAIREFLVSVLAEEGYSVASAEDGRQALEIARSAVPDLVLLDINMPEMNGYETCEALKTDPDLCNIPVMFISALDETMDKVRAFGMGAVDYITKPFQIEEVLVRVKTQLTLYHQHRELNERYSQIQELQALVKQCLSQSAWERLLVEASSTATLYRPRHEVLTILMTDVAGFTVLSETVEPNLLIADLSVYMSLLSKQVYQHYGEVDKFLGDGMLAFFRNAKDALRAAQALQSEIKTFNDSQGQKKRVVLPTRMSLTTGKVLLARLGSDNRHEYTLIGERVNVASRLQKQGPVGGMIIDQQTYEESGRPAFVSTDVVAVRGKTQSETVYLLNSD